MEDLDHPRELPCFEQPFWRLFHEVENQNSRDTAEGEVKDLELDIRLDLESENPEEEPAQARRREEGEFNSGPDTGFAGWKVKSKRARGGMEGSEADPYRRS